MNNPGSFQLTLGGSAFQIVGAGVFVGDVLGDLDGMLALCLQAQFSFGSGAGSCTAYVQTTIDQAQTWIDIAAFGFAAARATQIVNLSGLTPRTAGLTPGQQALAAGSCVDGVLGDRLRAVVVVTGAYNNSTLLNLTGVAR